jgi:hypothetical protein
MINVYDRIKVSQYNMPSVTEKEKIGSKKRNLPKVIYLRLPALIIM